MSVLLIPPYREQFGIPILAVTNLKAFVFTDYAGNPSPAAVGGWGVPLMDASAGTEVRVVTQGIVPVLVGANFASILPNQLIEADAAGCATPHVAGVPRGRTLPSLGSVEAGSYIQIVLLPANV